MRVMDEIMGKFIEYAIFDDDGLTGISSDAPQTAKDAYAEYKEMIDAVNKKGMKI